MLGRQHVTARSFHAADIPNSTIIFIRICCKVSPILGVAPSIPGLQKDRKYQWSQKGSRIPGACRQQTFVLKLRKDRLAHSHHGGHVPVDESNRTTMKMPFPSALEFFSSRHP